MLKEICNHKESLRMGKLLKNQTGFSVIELGLILVVVFIVGAMGYYMFKSSHPYTGWKTATLKYEKQTFKYPSSWKLTQTETKYLPSGTDGARLESPDKLLTVSIQTGFTVDSYLAYSQHAYIRDPRPLSVLGRQAYLVSPKHSGDIVEPGLALIETSTNRGIPAKYTRTNSICETKDGHSYHCPPYIYIGIEYSGEAVPITTYYKNKYYKQATLIVESLQYSTK